jgi:exonuclease III
MTFKIVTWNLNHCFRKQQFTDAWAYLKRLDPDVAFLQESPRPPDGEVAFWQDVWGKGWGTAVASRKDTAMTEIPSVPVGGVEALPSGHLERSHPGAWVAARFETPGGRAVNVVSVYGAMRKLMNGTTYATTGVHRTISDLTPLLDFRRTKTPVIMAGDFNVTPQIAKPDTEAHVAALDRIKAFGLVDCLGRTHGNLVQTHRHGNKAGGTPWQIDWVFSSPDLKLISCEPHAVEEAWRLSDHCPVVAEFES